MKTRLVAIATVVVCLLGIMLFYACTYTVNEGQQAVLTQFGRTVGSTTKAGLHFKAPFIQEVHTLEKRLLPWDGFPESMQTRDKKRIFIVQREVDANCRLIDCLDHVFGNHDHLR